MNEQIKMEIAVPERKIELASLITGYKEVSVGEFVKEHYEYFREHVNHNPSDCCNLRI